jgi:predicted heme/steroid binding protein
MPQTFTLTELARFDGKEGRPAYVAVDGTVYDVSLSATWRQGAHKPCHMTSTAGRDLSREIVSAPGNMRSLLAGMPVAGTLAPAPKHGRSAARAGLAALFVLVLAVPFLAMGLSGFRAAPASWTVLRTLALVAFAVLFLNVVIGAYRPLLNRAYRADRLQRLHVGVGVTAFVLALSHGSLALSLGIGGYKWPVFFGPSVLVLLAVVIATALGRRRLRRAWRWIHRLNYVLFAAVVTHAVVIGNNLLSQPFLKVIFFVYVAVATIGLAYRAGELVRRPKTVA